MLPPSWCLGTRGKRQKIRPNLVRGRNVLVPPSSVRQPHFGASGSVEAICDAIPGIPRRRDCSILPLEFSHTNLIPQEFTSVIDVIALRHKFSEILCGNLGGLPNFEFVINIYFIGVWVMINFLVILSFPLPVFFFSFLTSKTLIFKPLSLLQTLFCCLLLTIK